MGDFLDDVEPGQVIVIDNAGWDNCCIDDLGFPVLEAAEFKVLAGQSVSAAAEGRAVLVGMVDFMALQGIPTEYLRHLLTEIPKHIDDRDDFYPDDLLPWAEALPDICKKPAHASQPAD